MNKPVTGSESFFFVPFVVKKLVWIAALGIPSKAFGVRLFRAESAENAENHQENSAIHFISAPSATLRGTIPAGNALIAARLRCASQRLRMDWIFIFYYTNRRLYIEASVC